MASEHVPISVPAKPPVNEEAKQALEFIKPMLAMIPVSDLIVVNLDIPRVCALVLGVTPNLEPFYPRFAQLPEYDNEKVTQLRPIVLGTLYAHVTVTEAANNVATLVDEATKVRKRLLLWGDAAAESGFIDPQRLADVRAGSGFADTATDCIQLAAIFDHVWPNVEGKVGVTHEDLEHASDVGTRLLSALGMRDATLSGPDAHDLRQRGFTLLMHTYDEARRGLSYLRWREADVDTIAPSLFKTRRSRGPKAPSAEKPASTPAATAPATATSPATTAPGAAPQPSGNGAPAPPGASHT